ncbi:MAG TPA: hypothetical protein VJ964_02075 [Balneolaceae bacterium]|nr:hypothetical protein [Balneolaceae bacterium]
MLTYNTKPMVIQSTKCPVIIPIPDPIAKPPAMLMGRSPDESCDSLLSFSMLCFLMKFHQ